MGRLEAHAGLLEGSGAALGAGVVPRVVAEISAEVEEGGILTNVTSGGSNNNSAGKFHWANGKTYELGSHRQI